MDRSLRSKNITFLDAMKRLVPLALLFLLAACGSPAPQSVTPVPSTPIASSPAPSAPPTSAAETITVFFGSRDAEFLDPPGTRQIAAGTSTDRYLEALRALLQGPNAAEVARGAVQMFDPSVKVVGLIVGDSGIRCITAPCPTDVVHVSFAGGLCNLRGAAFNVGDLVTKTLRQFPEVKAVKIYLEAKTMTPGGTEDSVPECLQP
jgi:spore germination protein GerM